MYNAFQIIFPATMIKVSVGVSHTTGIWRQHSDLHPWAKNEYDWSWKHNGVFGKEDLKWICFRVISKLKKTYFENIFDALDF